MARFQAHNSGTFTATTKLLLSSASRLEELQFKPLLQPGLVAWRRLEFVAEHQQCKSLLGPASRSMWYMGQAEKWLTQWAGIWEDESCRRIIFQRCIRAGKRIVSYNGDSDPQSYGSDANRAASMVLRNSSGFGSFPQSI